MTMIPSQLTAPIVSLDRVWFGFGHTPILEALSLSIPPGELVILLGPSGSGKTTVLKGIAGLIAPQRGRIQVQAQRVAMVFQDHRLLPWRTACENVALGCLAHGRDLGSRLHRAVQLLRRCGFPPEAFDRYPHQLSGGMSARVAIARALAFEPDLLLMDEPLNGLDVSLRAALQDLVRDLVEQEHLTVIFVTHDLLEATRLGDRILILSRQGLICRPGLPLAFAQRDPQVLHQSAAELLRDPEIGQAMHLSP